MYCRSPQWSSVWWFTRESQRTQHSCSLQRSGRTWANSATVEVVVVVGCLGQSLKEPRHTLPEALSQRSLTGHAYFLQQWVVTTHVKLTQPKEPLSSLLWAETLPKPRPQGPTLQAGQVWAQTLLHSAVVTCPFSMSNSPASAWLTWVPSLLLEPAPSAILPFLFWHLQPYVCLGHKCLGALWLPSFCNISLIWSVRKSCWCCLQTISSSCQNGLDLWWSMR